MVCIYFRQIRRRFELRTGTLPGHSSTCSTIVTIEVWNHSQVTATRLLDCMGANLAAWEDDAAPMPLHLRKLLDHPIMPLIT
jgi:hypothetical protein